MKNKILISITAASGLGILIFGCLLDSTGLIGRVALIGLTACIAWIGLFAAANDGGCDGVGH